MCDDEEAAALVIDNGSGMIKVFSIDEWMNKWMNDWMNDEWKNVCMKEWLHE